MKLGRGTAGRIRSLLALAIAGNAAWGCAAGIDGDPGDGQGAAAGSGSQPAPSPAAGSGGRPGPAGAGGSAPSSGGAGAGGSSAPEAPAAPPGGAPPSAVPDPACPKAATVVPPPTLLPADPAFTPARGFAEAPFDLKLATAMPNGQIRYTLDGAPPTATTGAVYSAPIRVAKSTVVRAQVYVAGQPQSVVVAHPYILLGAFPPAVQAALAKLPSLSIGMKPADFVTVNTQGSGTIGESGGNKPYERPCSAELLYPSAFPATRKSAGFMANAGLRPHSWIANKRAYRLVFKQQYGTPKLKYPFFESAPLNAAGAAAELDKVVLRQSSNDGWAGKWGAQTAGALYLRDEFARASQLAASGMASRGTYVHLWVNGEYRGVYNPVERPDHDFLEAYLGGREEDYFAINHGGPIEGDPARYDALHKLARTGDLSSPTTYETFKSLLDVRQFTDYLVVSFFCTNPPHDWPVNAGRPQNWYAGVRNTPAGGVWHWVWDAEFCLSEPAKVHANFVPTSTTKDLVFMPFFFNGMKNADFRMTFADRAWALLRPAGALGPAASVARLQALAAAVKEPVTVAEAARWTPLGRAWDAAYAQAEMLARTNAAALLADLRKYGYYPALDAPSLSRESGVFMAGLSVEITNGNGKGILYYAQDGSDPRQSGANAGKPAAAATMQAGPKATITLAKPGVVKARVFDPASSAWSALAEATFREATPAPPACPM